MGHRTGKMRRWFLLAGILINPLALWLAWTSARLGHGSYFWACALFPLPLLLMVAVGETLAIAQPLILILAIFQFPAYGVILDYSAHKGHLPRGGIAILVAHSVGATLLFLPSFLS